MRTRIDKNNNIVYEITDQIPPIKKIKSQSTVQMLTMYGMYRNGLYDTRIDQPLDADIAVFKPKFDYTHKESPDKTNNHLFHYASHVSVDAMQELFKSPDSKCCIAYRADGKRKIPVGFLVYFEKEINNERMVYFSHLSVGVMRQGIGTHILQAVMADYPADTTFYQCARGGNKGALAAYEKLGFEYDHQYLNDFGYNPEYFIGMRHVTTTNELNDINTSLVLADANQQESFFNPYQSSDHHSHRCQG